jgi:hypothetical protein
MNDILKAHNALQRRVVELEKALERHKGEKTVNAPNSSEYGDNNWIWCRTNHSDIALYDLVGVYFTDSNDGHKQPNCTHITDVSTTYSPHNKAFSDVALWGVALGATSDTSMTRIPVQITGVQWVKIGTTVSDLTGKLLTVGTKLYPCNDGKLRSEDQSDAASKFVSGYDAWPFTLVRPFWGGTEQNVGLILMSGLGGSTATYTYDGPFACTIAPNQTQILIGANRAASAWAQDYILVHPDSIIKNSQEIVSVSSSGVVYYEIKREDWDTVAISATPYFAATLPVSTSMYFMIPLAGVTFAGGTITSVRQLQYGNIIIDKTSADYCP